MASAEEIKSKFFDMNITVSDSVLEKCFELCNKYNLEAEDFCDQWYAFTISNLGGAAPTVENLDKLERKEYQSSKAKKIISTPRGKSTASISEIDSDVNNLVNSYSSGTPKQQKTAAVQKYITPPPVSKPQVQRPQVSRNISNDYETTASNESWSEKYTQRKDSKAVQCSYGPTTDFKRTSTYNLSIENLNNGPKPDVMYMFEIMGKKAGSINLMTQQIGHAILATNALTLSEGPLKLNWGQMTTYGRIVSDSDKKINQQSVLLEGTQETNANHTTALNLNKVPKYSLFPGQVVVVEGDNVSPTTFVAERIYADAGLSLPEHPPLTSEKLEIVVAAGPFTLQDNISYEPLHDLLNYVNEIQPHVLILTGPFLDRAHDSLTNGSVTQTFDSFFEGLIENIMNSLLSVEIQVVVVASLKDANHHPVYPTPPYRIREEYPNLTFVSDPCMFSINGLVIAATTADILFHISTYELYFNKNTSAPADRMGRIASHLLSQRNFYPLCPPHKDIFMDHDMFRQFGVMSCKPHILILPSNLKNFVKNIDNCLVINPERLSKGFVGGTFAKIEIQPGETTSICDRVTCQVLRI